MEQTSELWKGTCNPLAAGRWNLSSGIFNTPRGTHPIEITVAEKLRSMVPCAERIAFGKNGSDVLAMAVRVARAYTGREEIFCCGYHGIHDWYMAGVPECPGIPKSLRALIHPFPHNDLETLEEMFAAHAGSVAAVVMWLEEEEA
jgi:glutamate-1-semialdehyde aminotransferase